MSLSTLNVRRRPSGSARREAGQILVMMGVAAIALIAILGLAIDIGRLYVAKAELSRAVDAAALAGVLELPDIYGAADQATAYLAENEPNADPEITPHPEDNSLTVNATKSIRLLFLPLVGIDSASVSAHAKAGFGVAYLDAALILDATGSMAGSPISNAKQAADQFKDTLLGQAPNGRTAVGVTPFRGCFRSAGQTQYAPKPLNYSNCVNHDSQFTPLTSNLSTLENGIQAIDAQGGSGTNVCGGLLAGLEILDGPGNHLDDVRPGETLRRYAILLSDGDNTYNNYSYQASPSSPHVKCLPDSSPWNSDGYLGTNCSSAYLREREIDRKTWQLAKEMEAQGIEIYVIGFGVCDHDASPVYTTAQCDSSIGNGDHDNTADERLLKCVASSKDGTNDHYFWAQSAGQLPEIFSRIANQIAHRLIE